MCNQGKFFPPPNFWTKRAKFLANTFINQLKDFAEQQQNLTCTLEY